MPSIVPRDGVMPFAFGLLIAMATLFAQDKPAVPYPDGFRSWTHVKSLIVGPDHESFAKRGGIHHYYANDKAVAGYRTGSFPDGAIIVDEAVVTKDGEGPGRGITLLLVTRDRESHSGAQGRSPGCDSSPPACRRSGADAI